MTRFEALAAIRARKPLLHCISNLVTANDCANLALAVGASPIMAQAPQEMADIAVLASAVVLNTGTPDEAKFTATRLAGAAANRRGIPVVLDPVGVGASPWRLENIRQLLQEVHPAILRANYGEAEDLVTDGTALHTVSGGSDLMRRVTGAGCMLTVLCGAFAAVQPQAPLQAAVQAAEFWKACAAAAEPQAHGPASFRVALLDAAAQIV